MIGKELLVGRGAKDVIGMTVSNQDGNNWICHFLVNVDTNFIVFDGIL